MRIVAAAALVAALTAPAALHGQQEQPEPEAEPTELIFEREVFDYPSYERRNPFQPLLDDDARGPRFERLRLLGIIHSGDAARSVALFGVGGGGQGDEATDGSRTYRLRAGEVLGNTRVVAIDRDRVLVEVEEFGVTEERVLELPRRGQGGS